MRARDINYIYFSADAILAAKDHSRDQCNGCDAGIVRWQSFRAIENGMPFLLDYLGLFGVALVAATLLPAQSEAVLAGMVLSGRYPVALLVLVASAGNILGSLVNWLLGRFIAHFEGRSWFPVRREKLKRAEAWYHRYGRWSLLLSWAPIIGDPLTLAAGLLREPLPWFLLLVTIAKLGRYVAVAALASNWA
jgi:membrane protein YqaA with SNARE-associated domain